MVHEFLLPDGFRAGFAGRPADGFSPALATTLATKSRARAGGVLIVGSLCSGIGGFDLGLERAGMSVVWQCEADEFCQRVLARRFPGRLVYPDVRCLRGVDIAPVDVIAAGFPCPVSSSAARGRNVGEWLWPECARIVRVVRPRYVIVENVAGLLYRDRGFGEVLGDLAACGFDAVWRVLRASDFGAPHHRARVWLVGYTHRDGQPDFALDEEASGLPELRSPVRDWPDSPACVGVDDGIPDRLERVRRLGNALVPQIAEWIGRRIVTYEAEVRARAAATFDQARSVSPLRVVKKEDR